MLGSKVEDRGALIRVIQDANCLRKTLNEENCVKMTTCMNRVSSALVVRIGIE